jgi:hypothetical protein
MILLHFLEDGGNDGLSKEARFGLNPILFTKTDYHLHLFVVKQEYLFVFAYHTHRGRHGGRFHLALLSKNFCECSDFLKISITFAAAMNQRTLQYLRRNRTVLFRR